VSYVTPNETEAARLTGIAVTDEDSARHAAVRLLAAGPKHVIVTLGSRGALVATAAHTVIIPSIEVDAVDSTAAGDAFNGALAVAIGRGSSLEEAVARASAVGALSVTRIGANPRFRRQWRCRSSCAHAAGHSWRRLAGGARRGLRLRAQRS